MKLRTGCCPMPKRRVPPDLPNDPTDPAVRTVIEKFVSLFLERCAVFKLDPNSKDFWRLMSYSFAFEHLLAGFMPPAKAKKTKPPRWTANEEKRLLESVRKKMAGGDTVENAIKALRLTNFSGKQKSLETRFYEAQKRERRANREAIAEILARRSTPTNKEG